MTCEPSSANIVQGGRKRGCEKVVVGETMVEVEDAGDEVAKSVRAWVEVTAGFWVGKFKSAQVRLIRASDGGSRKMAGVWNLEIHVC